MKKIKHYIPYIIVTLISIWLIYSFFDIIGNNQPWQEHNYWRWNFFEVMRRLFSEH